MKIVQTNLSNTRPFYQKWYENTPLGFDDFYEGEIVHGSHHLLYEGQEMIACFTTNDENYLTSLIPLNNHDYLYEKIFDYITQNIDIKGFIGITSDTFLLNEMISRGYQMEKQACNYRYPDFQPTSTTLVLAKNDDLNEIVVTFGDFLDNYEQLIHNKRLFLVIKNHEIVAMLNIYQHLLHEDSYSVGVIVKEKYRSKQIARNALRAIGNDLLEKGKTINAGCWFYNEPSKKALLAAGFIRSNIIYRAERIDHL